MAIPALAFLGDAAAGGRNVLFYGLGPLSLCGGCFWRHGHRNARLRDRELHHGAARGGEQ